MTDPNIQRIVTWNATTLVELGMSWEDAAEARAVAESKAAAGEDLTGQDYTALSLITPAVIAARQAAERKMAAGQSLTDADLDALAIIMPDDVDLGAIEDRKYQDGMLDSE